MKGKQYDEAVRAYRKEFPHELNLDLIMIDAYFEHKLFDRVLACIDGLDRSVGGDPYLDAFRANTHLKQGDLDAARRCREKAIEAEPDSPMGYLCLLTISLRQRKFAETSRLLTIVRDKFPQRMPKPEAEIAYTEYVRSRYYRTWMKSKTP